MRERSNTKVGLLIVASVIISCLGVCQKAVAQNYDVQKRITIYGSKFEEGKSAINAFLNRTAAGVQKKEERPERYTAEFNLPEVYLSQLDSLAARLGYVTENTMSAQNLQQQLRQLNDNLTNENQLQTELNTQLKQTGLTNEQRQQLQSRLDNNRQTLMRLQQELRNLTENKGKAYVSLSFYDEVSYPTGNSRVSLVNMPGFEVGYLRIENPATGISATTYRGYAIKYMFTKGKSYVDLGAYKALNNVSSDSTLYQELFLLNFGQDFYPRHFGRGKRKFLNLYTCYQVGAFIANQNNSKNARLIPNLNLGLGLELFKTRHLLLDNKISYFLPLHQTNRNLRGALYQASFNFVF